MIQRKTKFHSMVTFRFYVVCITFVSSRFTAVVLLPPLLQVIVENLELSC